MNFKSIDISTITYINIEIILKVSKVLKILEANMLMCTY